MHDLEMDLDTEVIGSAMYDFVTELFPLWRSITGDGIRAEWVQRVAATPSSAPGLRAS